MILTSSFDAVKVLMVFIVSVVVTNEVFKFIFGVEDQNPHDADIKDSKLISSIWCNNDHGDVSHKICLFQELCWLPKEEQFVIFINEESVVVGVDSWDELSRIDFSSVGGHNRFLMNLAVITNSREEKHPFKHHRIHEEREWIFFVWRFKPDNIMHVIHDDLLPMYYTYEGICGGNVERCIKNYKLIFVDEIMDDYSSDLYSIFSKEKSYIGDGGPVFLRDQWRNYSNSLICFKHARVGLSRSTTWFQYGFGKPQGPIENSNLTASMLRRFGQFLIQKMGLQINDSQYMESKLPPRALFLTRNISRKILNEEDLINNTRNLYSSVVGSNLNVEYFNPLLYPSLSGIREILKIVIDLPPISFIFGMHGAALTVASILSLAANIGCKPLAIMELFPMGIDPDAVSPIKALSKIPWLQNYVIYESWTNEDPASSEMPPPHLHPLQGGKLTCHGMDLRPTLKAVHCCHNVEYICRMYQDTIVDLKGDYLDKLRLLLIQQMEFKQDSLTTNLQEWKWYFPAPVTNVSCEWDLKTPVLELVWNQPLNVHKQIHHYDITVILETENVPAREKQLKGNKYASLKNQFSYQKKNYLLRVSKPHSLVVIPEEFLSLSPNILKATVWIQCVVTLSHQGNTSQRKSFDTYHICSKLLMK